MVKADMTLDLTGNLSYVDIFDAMIFLTERDYDLYEL